MNVSRLVRDTYPGLLSRIARRAANQTSGCLNFLDAVDDGLLLVSEAGFRRKAGQETGGDVPSLGHTHPVGLSLMPGLIGTN